jgi:hypothetical protein
MSKLRLAVFAFLAFASLLFSPTLRSQNIDTSTRVLLGGTGGDVYSNVYGGIVGKIEIPIKSRFEIDSDGEVSPHLSYGGYTVNLETKTGLGSGWGYNYGGTGIFWATKKLGIDGNVNAAAYSVTATAKNEYFTEGGLIYRTLWFGDVPTRFTFNYVREIANGILPNGDETNHLQGGSLTFDSRFGCTSFFCVRFVTNIQAGRVLTQGNPVCDGTYGVTTCPRSASVGGGASGSLYFEFPRHRGQESEVF